MKPGMIRITLFAAVAAAISSCKPAKPEVAEEPPPVVPATPIPQATPRLATPIAAITPAPDPLAPPGVFYLLRKASITTEEGIVGLKPGQSLRQTGPGTYEVGGRSIQLPDDQVTNNLRIAGQFATAYASAQAVLRQNVQQRSATPSATPWPKTAQRSSTSAPSAAGASREYLPGVSKQASGLDSSSTLGAGHTRTKDGWLWQKNSAGQWIPVRPLR